jgi:hypothetical protein
MRFVVGGQTHEITREQVEEAMRDAPIETIQKHVVEIEGQLFPPKQVFAIVTGRERQSFTTMEAQRVLTRLGFVCRRAAQLEDGTPAWVATYGGPSDASDPNDRLIALEASVGTMQAAIGGLHARVSQLEALRYGVAPGVSGATIPAS